MPTELREKIAADVKDVMDRDPIIKDRLTATGQLFNPGGPAEFGASKALLALGDQELDQFLQKRFPRLVRISRGRRRHDAAAYEAGREAGGRLKLHRGIHERSVSGRLLTS